MAVLDFTDLQDDIIESDRITQLFMRVSGMSAEEMRLSEALSEKLISTACSIAHGQKMEWDELFEMFHQTAEEHGFEHGMPIPTISSEKGIGDVITAKGTPLHGIMQRRFWRTAMEERLADDDIPVTNSWDRLGDRTICIVPTEQGPMAMPEYHYGQRLRLLWRSWQARMDGSLTVEAEERAMASLKEKINKNQWKMYVLNGCFAERSEKSDLHYLFRKGLPTLVMTFHGERQGAVIAALCLHPFGYHRGTFAGVMCPTDEVISALTLMRGDEHGFWKKSGQWRVWDVRSGI